MEYQEFLKTKQKNIIQIRKGKIKPILIDGVIFIEIDR